MARGFSPAALGAFELFFRPWMRRRLRVRMRGLPAALPAGRPVILVANHVGWWDGFLLRELHRQLRPDAPLYTVMLERELAQRPFFRRIGCVGIDPLRPASVARTLRALQARTRERPEALISFFPQGRIWPSHRRPLGFRRGVELLIRRLPQPVVLPVALHQEPLDAPAPTAFVSVGRPLSAPDEMSLERLEAAVTALLDAALADLARWGEAAGRRWASGQAEAREVVA